MGCFSSMLKYMVFLFNLVFFVSGCVIVGFGSYMYAEMNTYFDFVGGGVVNSAMVIIIIGVVIAVISFFGCCGACTEKSCMMYTFAAAMSLILVTEVGCGIAIIVYKNDVANIIVDGMKQGMENYGKSGYDGVSKTWDTMQSDFACCGVTAYSDWSPQPYSQGGKDLPDSCCLVPAKDCGKGALSLPDPEASVQTQGCFTKLKKTVEDNGAVVGGIGVGLGVIQLIGIVVTCGLAKKMNYRDNYV